MKYLVFFLAMALASPAMATRSIDDNGHWITHKIQQAQRFTLENLKIVATTGQTRREGSTLFINATMGSDGPIYNWRESGPALNKLFARSFPARWAYFADEDETPAIREAGDVLATTAMDLTILVAGSTAQMPLNFIYDAQASGLYGQKFVNPAKPIRKHPGNRFQNDFKLPSYGSGNMIAVSDGWETSHGVCVRSIGLAKGLQMLAGN